jgi:hypothetical protein
VPLPDRAAGSTGLHTIDLTAQSKLTRPVLSHPDTGAVPEDPESMPQTVTQATGTGLTPKWPHPEIGSVTSACLALRNPTGELRMRNRQASGFCPCVGLAASDRRRLAAKSATLAAGECGNSAFRVHT